MTNYCRPPRDILFFVTYLVALGTFKIVNKDDRLHWLKDGMPEALTTRLGAYPIFKIIERGQLDQVLNELNLGQSGIVDAESARQVGKILGAGSMLLGSVQGFEYNVKISVRFVDPATGEVVMTEGITGDIRDIFSLQDKLGDRIVEILQLKHDLKKRMEIEVANTDSIWAYLLYKKGERAYPVYRGNDINQATGKTNRRQENN